MFAQYGLPAQTTEIIGRERETQELQRLLLSGDRRLTTLTGPGGIGKTRLAIHTAALLADSFDDGVQFVPLAHVVDPALVPLAITQALGIQIEGAASVRDSLFSFLRRRRMLLVLDNFEQIVDAATDVAAILAECEHIKILVTSRIVLHVRGEHEFPVPPLALPASDAATDSLSQYAAVLLFIQRATAVRPDFRLTNANAPAVAEICSRLDGLPLAIELAAARVKILTPQAMLPRLNNRLQLLKGGAVDLPERQQTLRNTIAWSYELLEETEQDLFRKLAVFQGYWNLEAAEAICGDGEDILEGVQSLVDKSMVQQRELAGGEQYFILLETLREFAEEQLLADGEPTSLRNRHAQYYLALTESHNEDLDDDSYLRWIAAISLSFDNIRNAFIWLLDNNTTDAARLFAGLAEYWYSRGRTGEGMTWLKKVLVHLGKLPLRLQAEVLNLSGYFYREQGDIPAAARAHKATVDLLTPGGENERLRNAAMSYYGISLVISGKYAEAEEILTETLERQQADNDEAGMARTLMYCARCKEESGFTDEAIILLERSAALFRNQNLTRRMISVLILLASLSGHHNLPEVMSFTEEARGLCQRFGDTRNEVRSYINLAAIHMVAGRYKEAGNLITNGLTLAIKIDAARAQVLLLLNASTVLYHVPNYELGTIAMAYADTLMLNTFPTEYNNAFSSVMKRDIELFRTALTPDIFEAAWQKGSAISIEQLEKLVSRELRQQPAEQPSTETPTETVAAQTKPSASADFSVLTAREMEILRLLAHGLSNKEIGEKLFISERTVHAHVRSIYSKLDLASRSAATRFAVENGIA